MSALPESGPAAPRSVGELRSRFREGKAALLDHFRESRATSTAASKLVKSLTKHVDLTLQDLWDHAMMPLGAALIAVGGYGRGDKEGARYVVTGHAPACRQPPRHAPCARALAR